MLNLLVEHNVPLPSAKGNLRLSPDVITDWAMTLWSWNEPLVNPRRATLHHWRGILRSTRGTVRESSFPVSQESTKKCGHEACLLPSRQCIEVVQLLSVEVWQSPKNDFRRTLLMFLARYSWFTPLPPPKKRIACAVLHGSVVIMC